MEANDVLAHEVEIRRPVALEIGLIVAAVAQRRDVVDQRVHPHIGHVVGIERQRHAPVEAGTADGQIVQAAFHKGAHLVCAYGRVHKIGLRVVEREQPIAEL